MKSFSYFLLVFEVLLRSYINIPRRVQWCKESSPYALLQLRLYQSIFQVFVENRKSAYETKPGLFSKFELAINIHSPSLVDTHIKLIVLRLTTRPIVKLFSKPLKSRFAGKYSKLDTAVFSWCWMENTSSTSRLLPRASNLAMTGVCYIIETCLEKTHIIAYSAQN